MNNMFGWVEIPVTNMERAMTFYSKVLNIELERHQMGPQDMAWFPYSQEGTGAAGALVLFPEMYKPSKEGVLVYLSCGDIDTELQRVESAGGEVIQPKTLIAEGYGYCAIIIDTEGNRIALHCN